MLSRHEQLLDAIELLQHARQITVLTGAGISTESGIPDFRSPGSPWLEQPPVSYKEFITRAEARRMYWQTRRALSSLVREAKPNAAHHALALLEQHGKLHGLITQNFDGLHQDAGNSPERIVELHGTSREAACTLCGARSSIQELQARIEAGEVDPTCSLCGGYLKAATILFGQRVPEQTLIRAKEMAATCDLFLVVGSSLKVTPAASMPRLAVAHDIPLIIINLQPTPLDDYADVVMHEYAGAVLPMLVEGMKEKS
jgi:NAD-dependent deacetylase